MLPVMMSLFVVTVLTWSCTLWCHVYCDV